MTARPERRVGLASVAEAEPTSAASLRIIAIAVIITGRRRVRLGLEGRCRGVTAPRGRARSRNITTRMLFAVATPTVSEGAHERRHAQRRVRHGQASTSMPASASGQRHQDDERVQPLTGS